MNSSDFLKSTGLCESSESSEFFESFEFSGPRPGPAGLMIMKLKSKTSMTSITTSTAEFNQSINQPTNQLTNQSTNQSINQSTNQTPNQSIDQLIGITSANFTYTPKNSTKQNPIKKRKSDDMDEILLFTFSLNRQKINIKLQEAKTAMLKAYAMAENSHMLSIVNQINQLLDGNMKIVKIDTNIELLAMQAKLNMIIKNQFKLATKPETAKAAQDFKKSLMTNLIKPPQIKSPSHETFKSTETPLNFSSIKSSIVSVVSITTAKHGTKNSES